MNTKICPKCGKDNAAQMKFCSNCGQNLPDAATMSRPEEPPPTVFMGQAPPKPQSPPIPPPNQSPPQPQSPFGQQPPPQQQNAPNNPFGQQTPPNNPFGQQSAQNNPFGQQSAPKAPNQPQFSTPPPPAQPPKKSNKGLIFGAIGCLGLLVLSAVGLGIAGIFYYGSDSARNYPSPTPYASNTFSSNSSSSNTASNTNSTGTDSTSSTLLTAILESRKTVGAFKQTDVKSVVVSEYFPEGTGAAQASYSNGSKNVFLTVAQFSSMDDAKKNFNDQIRGVKSNGGKVVYENTASDGTISAIYEKGGYYFAEYCNTNNFCNRIHSNSRDSVKSFLEAYAKTN